MLRLAASVAAAVLAQAQPVQLSTADTSITLKAGPTAPRLSRLSSWENLEPAALIDRVGINGSIEPLRWQLQPTAGTSSTTLVRFVYESASPHLRLSWEWRIRAPQGPIEHSIRIENLGATELWLPLQDSFHFNFKVERQQPLHQFWVEKGASSPSAEGTHNIPLIEGANWTGTSSTYAHPAKGEPREFIPYLLIQRDSPDQDGWYIGLEFSGRTRIALRRSGDSVAGEAGLNPEPGPYKTRLASGAIFETPTIFLGAFHGGPDGAGNVLRGWIRTTLNNPQTLQNAAYPMLVSNSWGSGMAINEDQARSMIQDAAGLGLEMFHLDAGWFRGVGDWVSNREKFPHGVQTVAGYAHKLGLRFGLWTDWTQAGVDQPKMTNWLTTDRPPGWKPEEFKGITIDIGVPAAREWAAATAARIVSDFHLDMLEHDGYLVAQGCERLDHPHTPPSEIKRYKEEGYFWVDSSNATDVSYHAARAYYEVQAGLRRQFPNLLFEICNDGGRMVDFGSASHGDYFSITDGYDPLSNRRAFYDASYVLPPAMLETYVEKWSTPRIENFRYMLRSGLQGWFSLMQDSNTWTAEQHEAARTEFALYKSKLRPLIRAAELYHVTARPDGVHWDGIEYFDPAQRRGVLYAFHGSAQEDSHAYPLQGLKATSTYRLSFQDHTSKDYSATGQQLMRKGIPVRQPLPNSSELVLFDEVNP